MNARFQRAKSPIQNRLRAGKSKYFDQKQGEEPQIVRNEIASELHKPVRHRFLRRKVIVSAIDDVWGIDLVDMSKKADGGYKYILVVMDILSRYGWAVPLTSKSSRETGDALKKIMKTSGRNPRRIWADMGGEFQGFDNYHKDLGDITYFTTLADVRKVNPVERLNRTIKEMMWFKFTKQEMKGNPKRWAARLPKIMKRYNNTPHSGLDPPKKFFTGDIAEYEMYVRKLSPHMASSNDIESYLLDVLRAQVSKHRFNVENAKKIKPDLKVDDYVRIKLPKEKLKKGYVQKWSLKVYKVVLINSTVPVTYRVEDTRGNILPTGYYREELQKSKFTKDSKIGKKDIEVEIEGEEKKEAVIEKYYKPSELMDMGRVELKEILENLRKEMGVALNKVPVGHNFTIKQRIEEIVKRQNEYFNKRDAFSSSSRGDVVQEEEEAKLTRYTLEELREMSKDELGDVLYKLRKAMGYNQKVGDNVTVAARIEDILKRQRQFFN